MKKLTISMKYVKSTPGTHVYEATDKKDALVPTIYVKKAAFDGDPPDTITLNIGED